MAEGDIPSTIASAIRWVLVVIVPVFLLVAAERFADHDWKTGTVFSIFFLVTFVVAVKWKQIAAALARWRGRMLATLIGLAILGALMLGIAIGGLLNRGWQLGSGPQSGGRITWNFDQPGESFFLEMTRLNDQEVRIIGFQAHGKNTSTDPISEFSGFMRSDRTNEHRPIYLAAQESNRDPNLPAYVTLPGIPTPPDETFGIPGLADFDIVTRDKPYIEQGKDGVPYSQFIRDFGAFTIVLNYDNRTFERHFSLEQIKSELVRFEKQLNPIDTSAPRVTRRPTAKPVQMFPFPTTPELPLQPTQQPPAAK